MGADGDYTKEHNALAWDLICSTMYKIHLDHSSVQRMLMSVVHKDGSMVTCCRNSWS